MTSQFGENHRANMGAGAKSQAIRAAEASWVASKLLEAVYEPAPYGSRQVDHDLALRDRRWPDFKRARPASGFYPVLGRSDPKSS